jgi:DNA topoisomerase-1
MAVTDPKQVAACGLVFASDDEPGVRRLGHQRVRYVDESTGRPMRDLKTLARIRRLAVPPAWRDVWIAADPAAHIQATGRDARGRKQYRYHPDFRAYQDATKFDQLVPFAERLHVLRTRIDDDLSRHVLVHDTVTALVVALLDRTFMRVGNDCYARTNRSYGLTTLREKHVRINGSTLRIHFMGKSAKVHDVVWTDRRLARLLQRCQDLPGQRLFQWLDADGTRHAVRSDDVNDYLRAATDRDVTAKTFRTWGATVLATTALGTVAAATPERERTTVLKHAIELVADELGNTSTVCRASYVHPGVIDAFARGELAERWESASARGSRRLTPDERKVMHVLRDLS